MKEKNCINFFQYKPNECYRCVFPKCTTLVSDSSTIDCTLIQYTTDAVCRLYILYTKLGRVSPDSDSSTALEYISEYLDIIKGSKEVREQHLLWTKDEIGSFFASTTHDFSTIRRWHRTCGLLFA